MHSLLYHQFQRVVYCFPCKPFTVEKVPSLVQPPMPPSTTKPSNSNFACYLRNLETIGQLMTQWKIWSTKLSHCTSTQQRPSWALMMINCQSGRLTAGCYAFFHRARRTTPFPHVIHLLDYPMPYATPFPCLLHFGLLSMHLPYVFHSDASCIP